MNNVIKCYIALLVIMKSRIHDPCYQELNRRGLRGLTYISRCHNQNIHNNLMTKPKKQFPSQNHQSGSLDFPANQ